MRTTGSDHQAASAARTAARHPRRAVLDVMRLLLVPVALVAFALPAGAAPSVPAPTASATFDTPSMATPPPRQKQPAMTAAWAVAKPGREATLTVTGTPMVALYGYADALWTSAPIRVTRKGPIGSIRVSATGLLGVDTVSQADQAFSVRFTDARGRWGTWTTLVDEEWVKQLDPGTTRTRTIPIVYGGPVPQRALQVQVKVADDWVSYSLVSMTQTVQVKV